MTSSEPVPVVLAAGHLHPAILFLRFLQALPRTVFLALLGWLIGEYWLIAVAVLPFVMQMVSGLLSYLTVQYQLTTGELLLREGILHRQERRIPIDRIQDLAFESTLLRRVLGLVAVRVETASGKAAEAMLDSLGRVEAEQLRLVLQQARAERRTAAVPAPAEVAGPEPEPELLVHQTRTSDLVVRGLTDMRIGALLVTAFVVLDMFDNLGVLGRLRGIAGPITDWIARLPGPWLGALLLALAVAVLAGGAMVAVVGNVVQFWTFTLTVRDGVLQRRFGLLTTRQKTLPLRRVQRVTTASTWLQRPFGFCTVRADSASSGTSTAEDQKGGWDLVVPLADVARAEAVLPVLLPGLDPRAVAWQHVSPLLVARTTLEAAVLALVLLVPGLVWLGPASLLVLLLVPLAWLLGQLVWRNFGWAAPDGFVALRRGILGRYQAFIPLVRVQSVILLAGPVDRMFGLAQLVVHVAGGSPTALTNLTRSDAEGLRALIAEAAVAAAGREWRRQPVAVAPGGL